MFFLRSIVLILIIFLSSLGSLNAQEDIVITWNYQNLAFKDFTAKVESQYPLKFFYRDEWINDIKLGFYGENIPLSKLLDNLFSGLSLYYFADNLGNIVITKSYIVKISEDQAFDSLKLVPPSIYYDVQDEKKFSGNLFLEIGNPAEKNRAGNVVVSGYITDKDTKEPVSGATVYVRKLLTGASSNAYGFYSLTLPRGIHLVQFSFVGMKEIKVDLNLYGTGEMNIEMSSTLIPLKEAVVSADKNVTLQRPEVGMEKINVATLRLTPTTMGEADIVTSFLLVPGVQTVGEGASGFNVRGGSAGQNLILLNGAPLYNTSHFFGFFSAVNTDIIKDATLYKGGIPSRFGGKDFIRS